MICAFVAKDLYCCTVGRNPDDNRALKRTEFYYQVIEKAKNCSSQVVNKFNSYYALTEDDIGCMVEELKKKDRISFLRELKDYGLLYLTDSSKGYQTNVRCRYDDGSSRTEWRYCILKLAHLRQHMQDCRKPI